MLKSFLTRGVLASTLVMASAVGVAHAQNAAQQWEAMSQTKVSLVQAIDAAEKHQTGGKAVKAEYEAKYDKAYYEVDVITPEKRAYEVKVDAQTGAILSSKEDDD